jgi:hypothetical protein
MDKAYDIVWGRDWDYEWLSKRIQYWSRI